MFQQKINFVCTVCSETFTRKFGAKRHNDGTHAGTALFVRLIDYVTGRIEGRYQPSDPRLYRKKKTIEKNVKNMPFLENCKNVAARKKIPASRFITFADATIKNPYYGIGVTTEKVKSDFNRETNNTIPRKSSESWLNEVKRSDEGLNGIERKKQNGEYSYSVSDPQISDEILELREFFGLVQKYYGKETARDITACVKYSYNIGRRHAAEIDKWLPFLRNLDKIRQNFS
jgi:hypothetical protein